VEPRRRGFIKLTCVSLATSTLGPRVWAASVATPDTRSARRRGTMCAPFASHVVSQRSVALREIEGESGAVKAETCDECHPYAKTLYQANDMKVEPFAVDFATFGLDVLVAEAGWSRHAPNPFLLFG
jgi:formate dehydrogenase accessory protein FdhE